MKAFGIECPAATDAEFVELVRAAKTGDLAARDRLLMASLPLAQAAVRSKKVNLMFRGSEHIYENEVMAILAHVIILSIPRFDESRGATWRLYVIGRCIHRLRNYINRERDAQSRMHEMREGATQTVMPEEITDDPMRERVRAAMARLDPRHQEVLIGRFYRSESLREVGLAMGITQERVRQIETYALKELAKMIEVAI